MPTKLEARPMPANSAAAGGAPAVADARAVAAAARVPAERSGSPVVIKKYANRRLYNTEASSYVTLEDLAGMARVGRDFVVYDAKSGEDITRGVLTQIIVEEESKGRSMLPESFLRQLIGFYGDSLQAVVPRYLEFAMAGFARQQEQMRRSMETAIGGLMPAFPGMEEMSRQNMAMLERAMTLFAPFRPMEGGKEATPRDPLTALDALNREIEQLKQQLAESAARSATPPSTE
jgi:polyhydroxyalkanoate synthesis repressor PhaR